MSELSQVALEFCKVCLGWENARLSLGSGELVFRESGASEGFMPFDLNAVMEAVRKWCKENGKMLEVCFYDEGDDKDWAVEISCPGPLGSATGKDLCQALMAACVEASRKMHSVE